MVDGFGVDVRSAVALISACLSDYEMPPVLVLVPLILVDKGFNQDKQIDIVKRMGIMIMICLRLSCVLF